MRKRKTRSYTITDREHEEYIEKQLPYPTKEEDIDSASRLIVYALKRLPRKR